MRGHKPRRGSELGSGRKRRRLRERTRPEWLVRGQDLDEVARRRCLMVLSVLSGCQPVTEAITEAKISRGTYYQMETRALRAMLGALVPGAEAQGGGESPVKRIVALEKKISRLEREKRRAERLLYLTRQIVRPGPLSSSKGSRKHRRSTGNGRTHSPSLAKGPTSPSPSTPSSDGEAAP